MSKIRLFVASASLTVLAFGCSGGADSSPVDPDAPYRNAVTAGMHDTLATEIEAFLKAATDLQNAAPTTTGRGWVTSQDAAAIAAMRDAWKSVRSAYERIEGAIAPLFPEIDYAVDARYDDFLSQLNGQGDGYLFDDQGVTGQHAVERILYSDGVPAHVVEFERALPGYKAAAFPATEQEATDFKNKLCGKLVSDIADLKSQWQPSKIDLGGAFQGLIALMNEQLEKVNKAATQEEESRYSQRTLADLRDNLAGTESAYHLFQPWLRAKSNGEKPQLDGPTIDSTLMAGFETLRDLYSRYPGDAIPEPPPTWSSQNPSPQDLETDFGKLFAAVEQAVDPARAGSVVEQMNQAAKVMGFPEFTEGP
jgi:iron uptake system component EfeO